MEIAFSIGNKMYSEEQMEVYKKKWKKIQVSEHDSFNWNDSRDLKYFYIVSGGNIYIED